MINIAELRDAFRISNMLASQRARWCDGDPGAEPNMCRYCRPALDEIRWYEARRPRSLRRDGGFKWQVAEILRSPSVTYKQLADAIGVTPSVVRSWTFPIRGRRAQ